MQPYVKLYIKYLPYNSTNDGEEVLAIPYFECMVSSGCPKPCVFITAVYRITGNFRGSEYSWLSNISQFVVYMFVVQCSTTKTTNVFPRKLPAMQYDVLGVERVY